MWLSCVGADWSRNLEENLIESVNASALVGLADLDTLFDQMWCGVMQTVVNIN